MHVNPDRLLFMFELGILILSKRDSFFQTNTKNVGETDENTAIRSDKTHFSALRIDTVMYVCPVFKIAKF